MRSLIAAAVGFGLAVLVGMPSPAAAHGWHHGPRVGLFFGFGDPFFYGPPYPYYPYPYYPGPPVVVYRYAPPPSVVYASPEPVHAVPASPVYTDSQGRTCREYRTTVTIGGVQRPSYGTACLEPDGSWHIVQ